MTQDKTVRPRIVHLIPRHNPEEICSYDPNTGTSSTMLEEIRNNPSIYHRHDILLMWIDDQQMCVYPQAIGIPDWGGCYEYLTEDQRQWCWRENQKIIHTARKYPEFLCMLS